MIKNQHGVRKEPIFATLLQQILNVATYYGESLETMAMSQHHLEKGKH